jgi:ribose-phosphate pyrophosphokinase
MNIRLFAGSANPRLAQTVADALGVQPGECEIERFPDDELHVRLGESVRGCDVYLVQPTSPPADRHLFELLLMADAARRAGAARITAVVPYFGYARQDRRAGGREPVAARVVADMISAGAVDRLVTVDVHTPAIEGFFSIPVEPLSAVPLLAQAAKALAGAEAVLVAPDLGAAKLAERYARVLKAPVAIVHKERISGSEVRATRVTGDVLHRAPIIVDDMISTGGTIEAAADAVLAAGCTPQMTVVATHGLFVGPAVERLRRLPLRSIVVTDSVPPPQAIALPVEVVGIGPLLADAIRRLNADESLGGLLAERV